MFFFFQLKKNFPFYESWFFRAIFSRNVSSPTDIEVLKKKKKWILFLFVFEKKNKKKHFLQFTWNFLFSFCQFVPLDFQFYCPISHCRTWFFQRNKFSGFFRSRSMESRFSQPVSGYSSKQFSLLVWSDSVVCVFAIWGLN